VLAALTTTDVFACGVSRYGVADAVALALDTHDFESRYLDRLIGPYPEAAEVYAARAPINHVDGLSSPVLLLQGLDDKVVPPAQSRVFRDALRQRP
jgi:dipeptidyl aminopeptidase/acylaminoacyl peptidase